MVGLLVSSKAGHDKGQIYLVVKEENSYIEVVDGKLKKLDCPKRKNKKHVQVIKKYSAEKQIEMLKEKTITNEYIRRIIKDYCNQKKDCH